jgi:hypothetical protein
MTKPEIIEMIQRAGVDPVERDTVYNRVERANLSELGAGRTGISAKGGHVKG